MKPESRAALLKAQSAVEEAYRVCLEEALNETTHEKRVKIAGAIINLPRYASDLAEMVDPKPPGIPELSFLQGMQQDYNQRLHTQGGGILKKTAAW